MGLRAVVKFCDTHRRRSDRVGRLTKSTGKINFVAVGARFAATKEDCASSPAARLITTSAPCRPNTAIMLATIRSGHPALVLNTPAAANTSRAAHQPAQIAAHRITTYAQRVQSRARLRMPSDRSIKRSRASGCGGAYAEEKPRALGLLTAEPGACELKLL